MWRLCRVYLVTQQSRDTLSRLVLFAHLALPKKNVRACLEQFVRQAHQQSVPAATVKLFSIPAWHITHIIGSGSLSSHRTERWSRCQQSSYKACHLFQTAQDACWAHFSSRKLFLGKHCTHKTLEALRSAWSGWTEITSPSKQRHFSSVHPLGSQWHHSFEWW